KDRASGKRTEFRCDEVLIAAGREPVSGLHPERAGIATDGSGWIKVDEYLRTSQPNVWAFGDANGFHQFKHKANYESWIAYQNAVEGKREKANYDAVPHAVFTHPEVAGVGMGEALAVKQFGARDVLVGVCAYEDTAKGFAIGSRGHFCK